jgi:hypothetical protein
MNDSYKGLPLQFSITRPILIKLFDSQDLWRNDDLVRAVVKEHEDAGGVVGRMEPSEIVRKMLYSLREEGRIESPVRGVWVKKQPLGSKLNTIDLDKIPDENSTPTSQADEEMEEIEVLSAKKSPTIGVGTEAVYLYFNPSEKELADIKHQTVWECKIGMTTVLPVEARIFSQGVKTAFSKAPTIGLVMLTNNAYRLEKALHHALHMVGAEAPESLGSEWFLTNPEKIQAWYETFIAATEKLKN